jgi:Leucine-rich repeat (LRR) protein
MDNGNIKVIIQTVMSVEILGRLYDTNTKGLNYYDKKISKLPESIGNLVNLQYLHLHNNQLTALPESISKLVSLEYLYLHNNQLTTLPESIDNLVKLKELSLYNNQLKNLPASILNIKKSLRIWVNAYEINNLSMDIEFLIFSYLDKELTNLPLKSIGYHFGGRDHSTVIHAVQSISEAMETDKSVEKTVRKLFNRFNLSSN